MILYEYIFISSKKIVLESGDEYEFTHCVIATGSLGPVPARSKQVYSLCYSHW